MESLAFIVTVNKLEKYANYVKIYTEKENVYSVFQKIEEGSYFLWTTKVH